MNCLTLESHNPYFNLAVEEFLLKNRNDEYFILAINAASVIIGKHQSPHRETNTEFLAEHNIPVIRRISGGGTVFHDMGNLNFTFIKQSESGKQVDFLKYTQPVIEFLSSLGVNARFEGKNDLKVNGLKISGNAEHVHRDRVLHHGTLLFSASEEFLGNSFRKDTSCYKTRAVGSNPSSVLNLNKLLTGISDIFEFRNVMMNYFLSLQPGAKRFSLSEDDIREIKSLAASKYQTWEWNYAYGPEYQFIKQFDYQRVKTACALEVKDGIINRCSVEGHPLLAGISCRLIGCRHMVDEIRNVFNKENIKDLDIYSFF